MVGFDSILKSVNWSQNFQKPLGLSFQISEILNAQERITKNFSGVNMMAQNTMQHQKMIASSALSSIQALAHSMSFQSKFAVPQTSLDAITSLNRQHEQLFSGMRVRTEALKFQPPALASMQHQRMIANSALSSIQAITKSINFQSKFAVPETTLNTITSLNQQQKQLFSKMKVMADTLKIQSPAFAQIKSIHVALNSISRQVAEISARQNNWKIIDDFEQVAEQALNFTEELVGEITQDQQKKFHAFLILLHSFLNKYKALGLSTLLIIDIFVRFADLHQYYDFLKEKPALPTKSEVNQISRKLDTALDYIYSINQRIEHTHEYQVTNQICEVKGKPESKKSTIGKLPKGFEIIVIQSHHKWVYVSYFDPQDNLPQTGWVMKKYLDKPKQN